MRSSRGYRWVSRSVYVRGPCIERGVFFFFFFDSSVPYSHCAGVCDEVRDTGVVWGLRCSLDWDREMDERTLVYFVDNSVEVLEAYVENGEGFDRAGGFAVQVRFRF